MDLIADRFPMGCAFWSSCLYDFEQLPKGTFPDLTEEQVPALFERWARRYEARDQEQERARPVRTLRLWYERDRLMAQMKFLPDGPERAVVGNQLWELANKVADLYARSGHSRFRRSGPQTKAVDGHRLRPSRQRPLRPRACFEANKAMSGRVERAS